MRVHHALLLLCGLSSSLVLGETVKQHPLTSESSFKHDSSWSAFEISSLARNVDLGGTSSKSSSVYTLKRRVNAALADFVFAVNAQEVSGATDHGKLAWLEVTVGKTSASKRQVPVRGIGYDTTKQAHYYSISIGGSSESEVTVTVNQILTHASKPKPAVLPQDSQVQGLVWQGDLLGGAGALDVSLPAGSVKVKVKAPTMRVEKENVPSGWTASHTTGSTVITYTNVDDTSAGQATASVLYEQPDPMITFAKLDRTLMLSHWGNHLSVQDDIALLNSGPALRGYFSRFTHQASLYMQRQGVRTPHILTGLSMALPPNVYSPYYIDEVGNVSTSKFRPSPKVDTKRRNNAFSQLDITPRYPIMGGWNYTFSIGYKQPLADVLRYNSTSGRYTAALAFITPVKDVVSDHVTVKVVLPEGASDIIISPPFPVDEEVQTTTFTYLDTRGRPTIVLRKTACTERHALDMLVSYKYTTGNLLHKPLVITSVLLGLFFMAALLRRARWTFM